MSGVPLTLHLTAPVGSGSTLARRLGARRGRAVPLSLTWPDTPGARFDGTARALHGATIHATLQEGTLRQHRRTRELCHVTLSGPANLVLAAALSLAEAGAAIAPAGIDQPPAPEPPPTPPVLTPDLPTGDAFAALTLHLAQAVLRQTPHIGMGTEPVHQMRVAVRRLRSALGLFRRAVGGPEVDAAKNGLRMLMRLLGPARDWDVFLTGLGPRVAQAVPDEATMPPLLAAAQVARAHAYTALAAHLHGSGFRALCIRLVWLGQARPWTETAHSRQAEALATPLGSYAAQRLQRSWARMAAAGEDIADLPAPALHALRLRGKRMRYACEFFAPLFPGRGARRWMRRLAALQEALGHLNDAAVAAELMQALGPPGEGHAGGLVRGYVAAGTAELRTPIAEAWHRLHRLAPFWD